jgi:polyferredoxin
MVVVASLMLWLLFTRETLTLSVLRDRNPLYVPLSDGQVRNGYTLKIINRAPEARTFTVTTAGVEGATVAMTGHRPAVVEVPADDIGSFHVFVSGAPPAGGSSGLTIVVRDGKDGRIVSEDTTFRGPER